MNLSKISLSGNRWLVILFLRKLYSRRVKTSFKRNLIVNYFIYKNFFYKFNKNKLIFLYRHFVQLQKCKFSFNPSFMFNKQFFAKHADFNGFLINNNIEGFFFHKRLANMYNYLFLKKPYYNDYLFGYNYYSYVNYDVINKYLSLNNTDDLFKVKLLNEINIFTNDFNFFVNYNIFILNVLEIYKILILLNLYNLK
jgi:hypothetical protein